MINIKGKDGSIKIEKKISEYNDCIVYKFYYKNDDISFSSQEIEAGSVNLKNLYFDLQRMVNSSSMIEETLNDKPVSRLKKLFKNIFSFRSEKLIKKDFSKCSVKSLWPYGNIIALNFERIEGTLDFLINFTFFYDDMNNIKLKGFFVVSKDKLIKFEEELYQFI